MKTDAPEISPPRHGSRRAVSLLFGEFRLDEANAALVHGAIPVALTPKAFSVLHYLAMHAGRLVTKDEFLVGEIRRALGDDAHRARYVETAHRRGYRFVAPVKIVIDPMSDAPLLEPEHAVPSPANVALPPPPATHYAQSGNVNIAYQVVGNGPIDLVFVMGWVSHLDYFWREPSFARFLNRLASFSRLILFDKRGTGLSDRVTELPTLEQRMDDVRAVLEAVGSKQAVLLGVSEGGPLCSLYATTYPERTLALVMIGTYAKRQWAPDYPWAPTAEQREQFFDEIRRHWGGPVGLEARAPSKLEDLEFREWWSTYLRMGASPGAALALTQMNADIDVRDVLPSIRVPTLILHRTDDRCLAVEEGRYVAAAIPGATFVELPGHDHLPFVGDQESMLDAIEQFLEGRRHAAEVETVLATVLSAEVHHSTSDERISRLFDAHVRKELEWFRGRPLAVSGARVLAAFDGPARAIRCATAIVEAAPGFERHVRAGLHTGECHVDGGRMQGAAVAVAARLSALAAPGDVFVSRTVKDLVAGSGLEFDDRGLRFLAEDGVSWTAFAARARRTA
jgi:pimeloyl-ACP methyl ester carboxylesterase/DNA-binding winged helix-turn-helix (wHTH) protein